MTSSTSPSLRCTWHGPFSFSDLLSSQVNRAKFLQPGVYLWIDSGRQPEELTYVGVHLSELWTRQWDHYFSQISGHYPIPASMRCDGERWDVSPTNPRVASVIFDVEQYVQLVRDGFAYAAQFQIYLCPLPAEVARQVEAQLLYELCPTGTVKGTKQRPSMYLDLQHECANWLTPTIRRQVRETVKSV